MTDDQAFYYLKESVLAEGEEIQWTGRPAAGAAVAKGISNFLFGIFFFGFAVFWTVGASQGGLFALFGIPFMAVGAWMISAPVRTYIKANKSYYAVTNKRVIILTVGRSYTCVSIAPNEISDYERTDKPNGTGNTRLRKTIIHGRNGIQTSIDFTDGLWGVSDTKGAADAITALRT
ncbi:MAG: hypothetical protein CMM52_01825 [Rhodospirillaceae bacterium]|nr:hypothetical protein [Rhodospirillaceae bacterium]|tara:strand:+ start:54643 stop:55170 length:528 start_codon:yes stop_codon:yes gene_type:complete